MYVGTLECIYNVKVLLEYHLVHLKQVEQLRQEKLEIDQLLCSIQNFIMGSMQGLDHSYSSDMDVSVIENLVFNKKLATS